LNSATPAKAFQKSRILALLLSVVLLAVALSGCSSSRRAAARQTIRVLTWNIHHAEGTDKKIDVDRIAQLITEEKADIVAIQEVDRGVERTSKIDIITKLADLTGMTYAFGKTIDFQGGDYGNAFLTRLPIFEEKNFLYRNLQIGEQRGVLVLVLGAGGEELVVANTHFESRGNDSARIASANELKSILKGYSSRPLILCGDFNVIPTSPVVSQLKEEYLDAWEQAGTWEGYTFPSDAPGKRIDYVFTGKNRTSDSTAAFVHLRPLSARVVQSLASDHRPVLVELELTTER
jgi:endonuclease/exonuclease/phosphatase family metal-dependent hydrolase